MKFVVKNLRVAVHSLLVVACMLAEQCDAAFEVNPSLRPSKVIAVVADDFEVSREII